MGESVRFTLAEIKAARAALGAHIVTTPTIELTHPELKTSFPQPLILKLELFQVTGSFKPRGALTVILNLAPEQLRSGVTAVSAGNHAVAVAYGAQKLGVSAKLVMIATASPARVALAKAYGAEIILAPDGAAAFADAERIAQTEGRSFIHPFEGPFTALGTATLGLELAEQAPDLDAVVVAIGGGGLAGGCGHALRQALPQCALYGVEPTGANTMTLSLARGAPVERRDAASIADSLAPPFALPYSFGLCRDVLDRVVMVSDSEIAGAMRVLFDCAKLAVEPAGAAAMAAVLGPLRDQLLGKRVGVVVCGAVIDWESYAALMQGAVSQC